MFGQVKSKIGDHLFCGLFIVLIMKTSFSLAFAFDVVRNFDVFNQFMWISGPFMVVLMLPYEYMLLMGIKDANAAFTGLWAMFWGMENIMCIIYGVSIAAEVTSRRPRIYMALLCFVLNICIYFYYLLINARQRSRGLRNNGNTYTDGQDLPISLNGVWQMNYIPHQSVHPSLSIGKHFKTPIK